MSDQLACNLQALTEEQRSRRKQAAEIVLAAVRRVRELPNGYELTLVAGTSTEAAVGQFVELEGKCCPFLDFRVARNFDETLMVVTGPEGVKQFLAAQFGLADFQAGI